MSLTSIDLTKHKHEGELMKLPANTKIRLQHAGVKNNGKKEQKL